MRSFNKIPSPFQIDDFVQLRPPTARITAITFEKDSAGNVVPFYDAVTPDGHKFQGIPESEILGHDAVALHEYNAEQAKKPAKDTLAEATSVGISNGFAGAGAGENTPYAGQQNADAAASNDNGERTFGDLPEGLKTN